MEYNKCRQSAKRVISFAKEKKEKECASHLNDPERQNEIFRMAKQMVKERQDITGSNCLKGVSMRKLAVEEWLVSAVMSMYRGAKTVVKTGTRKRYCIKYRVSYITNMSANSFCTSLWLYTLSPKKKEETKLCKFLTDFHNSFTFRLCSKFPVEQ